MSRQTCKISTVFHRSISSRAVSHAQDVKGKRLCPRLSLETVFTFWRIGPHDSCWCQFCAHRLRSPAVDYCCTPLIDRERFLGIRLWAWLTQVQHPQKPRRCCSNSAGINPMVTPYTGWFISIVTTMSTCGCHQIRPRPLCDAPYR